MAKKGGFVFVVSEENRNRVVGRLINDFELSKKKGLNKPLVDHLRLLNSYA